MALLYVETPEKREEPGEFQGYGSPNFVMLPRIFIRHQMQDLTEAELKVMLYIFDHTWGYSDGEGNRKDADAISRSQFLNGIRRLDGTQLDRGAGVSDRSLDRALDNLVKRGYIFRHRRVSASGRSDTNIYELNRYGKPCLAPALGADAGTGNNRLDEHVPAQALIHTENIKRGLASEVATTVGVAEKQIDDPRKFTPLPSRVGDSTPANLRPYPPANLRPSTPVNLLDTIENSNNKKIKQHTIQVDPQDSPANAETTPDQDSQVYQVCVASSSNSGSEKSSSKSQKANDSGETTVNTTKSTSVPLTGPGEKVKTGKSVSQASKDPIQAELALDLLMAGVAKKEAEHLAALARQNGHNDDYVKQALQYIDRQRSVHNREGLLIHLVKTNWQPVVQEATSVSGSNGSQMVVPLPSANSIRPEHLPRLIEIEKRNVQEATSHFERETARARLVHFQTIAAQLNPNEASSKAIEEKKG